MLHELNETRAEREEREAENERRRAAYRRKLAKDESKRLAWISELTQEQTAELYDAFSVYDRNHNGVIAVNDLGNVMRLLGMNPTEPELMNIIHVMDDEDKGRFKLNQFMQIMAQIYMSEDIREEVKNVFKVFDPKGTGKVKVSHMREAMTSFGASCSDEEFDELISYIDINKDGVINYSEFAQLVQNCEWDRTRLRAANVFL